MRWWGVGKLDSACVHYIFPCRQNDSSLEVRSLDLPHIESSCTYPTPTCNWCALGFLDLKDDSFFVAHTRKMTIFVTGLALELPGGTPESFYMFGITTLWTSISSFIAWLGLNFLKGGLWLLCSLEYLLWLFDLNLWECCFCLALLGGMNYLRVYLYINIKLNTDYTLFDFTCTCSLSLLETIQGKFFTYKPVTNLKHWN